MKVPLLFPFFILATITFSRAQDSTSLKAKPANIYVVGKEYSDEGRHFAINYWKNGKVRALTDGLTDAEATGIFVSDTDVYISGYEKKGKFNEAKYWKNTLPVTLYKGRQNASANSIFVSDNEVYVAGTLSGRPVLWKNNRVTMLPVRGVQKIYVLKVIISNGDVYTFGGGYNGNKYVLLYWKNGVPNQIADSLDAFVQSAFVSGNDTYIVGYERKGENDLPAYWKNGTCISLEDNTESFAQAIFVSGNDVYVAGEASSPVADATYDAFYWKNKSKVPLSQGSWAAAVNSIYVAGNDVYVAGARKNGTSRNVAAYWKNGKEQALTDGSNNAIALGIVVK